MSKRVPAEKAGDIDRQPDKEVASISNKDRAAHVCKL
jgi:hypothetical protein